MNRVRQHLDGVHLVLAGEQHLDWNAAANLTGPKQSGRSFQGIIPPRHCVHIQQMHSPNIPNDNSDYRIVRKFATTTDEIATT